MDFPKTISLLHRKMNKVLNIRLARIGLSSAQARLLKLLFKNREMTQVDLCKALDLDKSTVAKKLFRMEASGLIEKRINPDDGRSFLVLPTKKAIKIIPESYEIFAGWTKDVTASMTDEEMEVFYKVLDKIVRQAALICNSSD